MGKIQLEPKHWALIAGGLTILAMQISSLDHGWRDAITPGFVGSTLGQFGLLITSLFVGAPKQPWDGTLRRCADARATDAALNKAADTVAANTAAAVVKAAQDINP